ncbi:MAG: adenylate cyclase [Pseudorhodobacter sp. PARRP1]|nr:MAG: adenylate cyclase [Pseudorhodobacter sp. PARRP1]
MNDPRASVFLSDLPTFAEFEDVANLTRYRPLPEGWALAVADVVSSTEAIAQGKYKSVNMAGASVITAVLNGLEGGDYPFVFGGDGAVIAVPPNGMAAAGAALAAVARWIEDDLGLNMRTALVPLDAIRAAGHDVGIARFQASSDMTFAMFAGGGAAWAEAQMKLGRFAVPPAEPGSRADLTGLSCRWNPIASRNGQIVSIIAVPRDTARSDAFRTLVADVVAVANKAGGLGNPLPPEGPVPHLSLGGVASETNARAPRGKRMMARLKVVVAIFMTVFLYRTNLTLGGFNARDYARQMTRNTDFRKFDDGLKMTLDINAAGLAEIEALLDAAASAGVCQFGLHKQDQALVTCIVPSLRAHDHMHFIDGAAGGYAQAATHMKAKAALQAAAAQ